MIDDKTSSVTNACNDCLEVGLVQIWSQNFAQKPVSQVNQHLGQLFDDMQRSSLPASQIRSSSSPPPAFCWGTPSPPPPASSWSPPCPSRSCPTCSPAPRPPPHPQTSFGLGWKAASCCWGSSCWVFSGESQACPVSAVWGLPLSLSSNHTSCVASNILGGYLGGGKNLKKSLCLQLRWIVDEWAAERWLGAYQLAHKLTSSPTPESDFRPALTLTSQYFVTLVHRIQQHWAVESEVDPFVCLFVYKQEKLTHVGRPSLSIDKELPLMSRLGLVDPIVFTLDFEK